MKVVIAGGGIAGMACAIALQRQGADVVVHESTEPADAQQGLFLSLASNGLNALRDLGAPDLVERLDAIPTPWMTFHTSDGRQLARVPMGLAEGPEPVTVMRADLCRALTKAAQSEGVMLQRGSKVAGYRTIENGVAVRLEDGTETNASLLVGADGIHSQIRQAMPGNAAQPAYSGLVNFGGVVPGTSLDTTKGDMRMVWGHEAFFGYTVRPGGEAWWFANIAVPERDLQDGLWRGTAQNIRARLVDTFSKDDPVLRRLVEATAELKAYPIHDLAHVPCWHDGRVVLVGDAAHATSPSSGQGAALALEDAGCLAAFVESEDDLDTALQRFVSHRRPRAERIVEEGRKRGRYKAPRSALQRWVRDLVVPVMLKRFVTHESMEWIYGYRVSHGL